ncbi:MAG TPA: tRNA (N6-threonylcarbamoyladenosine(37)-N6)-methyltransferase TrmO [Candidatus Methylomirabilis sp.]|nr:tRNA (N6-threonylcarbamoyladenosine(37)-N6)-methyltransferase TrmO [Candidatus Methylomirabilis sp.]
MTDLGDLYSLRPIGIVRSPLRRREDCPHQGYEGAPEAWVELDPAFADGFGGIMPGDELILLTWLHEARRDVLKVHPRGKKAEPLRGVFLTRSPDRPNPIGLHRVKVIVVETPTRILVGPLEALDGTPIIDIKTVLAKSADG